MLKSHLLVKTATLDDAADESELIFLISVDGTHCPIQEPFPFSKDNSSHKRGGKPAVNYEVAVLLHEARIVWVKGPTQPGKQTDLMVFTEELHEELLRLGRRAIGDGIYASCTDTISSKNRLDPRDIRKFKDNASARHEALNGLLKNFNVLKHEFRHQGKDFLSSHKLHFLAVAVLVQAQLDNGSFKLFDVYP